MMQDVQYKYQTDAPKQPSQPKLLQILGPGLITGASDDDPSGIATYSQAGAQFGFQMCWTLLFSWPLMCIIQEICARIGRVSGRGLAGVIKAQFHPAALYGIVALLIIANTINIGADLGAMAAALKLVIGGPTLVWLLMFATGSVLLQVFVHYSKYVTVLKWLTLSLFSYVAVTFAVKVPWLDVARNTFVPKISFDAAYLTVVVAILGTTISPYLFFWQAGQEVEEIKEQKDVKPLKHAPEQAEMAFSRIRIDTYLGMGFSNLVAFFIVITAGATLNANGVTDIQTSAQAAEALRPIAGDLVFWVFALGIIGTGLLALPVLAGSSAYAVGEALGWKVGLGQRYSRAKGFYGILAASTAVGLGLNYSALDPVKALFWSAVINGVVAVPLMVMIMLVASRKGTMGRFVLPLGLKVGGWMATTVMLLAAGGMFATWGR